MEFVRLHRPFFIAVALVLLSYGAARAAFGADWFQISTPCVPTAIAVDRSDTVFITCPGDRHIYYKQQ